MTKQSPTRSPRTLESAIPSFCFVVFIVTAAMEQIPDKLQQRLEPGGILIAPVGPHHGTQTLVRVAKSDTGFDRKDLVDVRFVPALPGIAREL